MSNKTTVFDNELQFRTYVSMLPISIEKQQEIIEHEKAHYETAQRLGYSAKYAIEEAKSLGGFRKYRGSVIYDPEVTNPEHIRQIISAPESLSQDDKKDLEEILGEPAI